MRRSALGWLRSALGSQRTAPSVVLASSVRLQSSGPGSAGQEDAKPRKGSSSSSTVAAATAATVKTATLRQRPTTVAADESAPAATAAVDSNNSVDALRRRRAPAPESKGNAGEPTLEEVFGVQLSATDELARAFNRFAGSIGGCSDTEFLQGARQVYYSTAAMTGLLAAHAKPAQAGALKLESAKVMAAAEEARRLIAQELLPEKQWKAVERAAASPSTATVSAGGSTASSGESASPAASPPSTEAAGVTRSTAPDAPSAAATAATATAAAATATAVANGAHAQQTAVGRVVAGITSLLPMSTHLAETIFKVWCLQKEKKANLFNIAGPTDYVLDSRMVVFARLDEAAIHFSEEAASVTGFEVTYGPAFLKKRQEQLRAANPSPADSDRVAATAAPASSPAASEAEDAVTVKVNGSLLPPIPSSALACVVLTMDVVVPPERFANNYEWYYNRIVGYDSEYERIAAARLFAQNTPKGVATFFDFLTRMFTGKPVEFMFTKAIGKMVGLPENMRECPPATRKLMCMHMDKTKRWILSDIIPLEPVNTTKVPQ